MNDPDRLERLRHIIGRVDRMAVAYSGGTDSTLLLRVARDVLGPRVSAIICDSGLMPSGEVADAVDAARGLGVEPVIVRVDPCAHPRIVSNPPDRCYHCKRVIFEEIRRVAASMDIEVIADGTHAGDRNGDRPGIRALRELGVRSPLAEAGLDKEDIRETSRELGLPTALKPSSPCLATRIPFNETITPEKLRQVDEAERLLRELGYRQVRVRHYGQIARVEVEPRLLARTVEDREVIISGLTALGFVYVTLDLGGFRSGSMSEALIDR